MEHSNCLIFALALRLRWGGQILRFPSWYYRGPHFMWRSECGRFIADYVPIVRHVGRRGRKRWFPRPMFKGRVRVVRLGDEIRE